MLPSTRFSGARSVIWFASATGLRTDCDPPPISKYLKVFVALSSTWTGRVGLKIAMFVNTPPVKPPPFSMAR